MNATTPTVLLSASNLSTGGGVQVAASLVDELSKLAENTDFVSAHPWISEMVVEVSPEVRSNLASGHHRLRIYTARKRWWHLHTWILPIRAQSGPRAAVGAARSMEPSVAQGPE